MSAGCDCYKDIISDQNQKLNKIAGVNFQRIRMFIVRSLAVFRWFLPGAVLLIIPKCPLCLAAYVLVGSGIGLSVASATYLRGALIFIFGVTFLYFCSKWLWMKCMR